VLIYLILQKPQLRTMPSFSLLELLGLRTWRKYNKKWERNIDIRIKID